MRTFLPLDVQHFGLKTGSCTSSSVIAATILHSFGIASLICPFEASLFVSQLHLKQMWRFKSTSSEIPLKQLTQLCDSNEKQLVTRSNPPPHPCRQGTKELLDPDLVHEPSSAAWDIKTLNIPFVFTFCITPVWLVKILHDLLVNCRGWLGVVSGHKAVIKGTVQEVVLLFDVLEHTALLQALPVQYRLARVLGQAHLLEPLHQLTAKKAFSNGGLPTPDIQRQTEV